MEFPPIPEFLRREGRRKSPLDLGELAAAGVYDPRRDEPDVAWPSDLSLQTVYYINGAVPKNMRDQWRASGVIYEISSPPHAGYGFAVVIGKPDARRVTVFCPYSFESFNVHADAGELCGAQPVTHGRRLWLEALLRRKWDELQGFGFLRDYDTAALVFNKLGMKPPEQLLKGGEEDNRRKGGKETGKALLKPVKRKSKRGKFLEWFLKEGGVRSVREAMAEFGMTRSNALSYLFMLNKDHGIGYSLVGDTATLHMPECESPFDDDQWMN